MRWFGSNPDFEEWLYLEANPDVEDALLRGEFLSAREHWLKHGRKEGRIASLAQLKGPFPPEWNEIEYLRLNPDVYAAVRKGEWESGYRHWKAHGAAEDRPGGLNPFRQTPPAEAFRNYPAGCNYYGFHLQDIGLGAAARSCFEIISKVLGNAVAIPLPWDTEDWEKEPFRPNPEKAPYGLNLLHVNPDALPQFLYHHGVDSLRGRVNIGYWAWELHAGYAFWGRLTRLMHEIWVPSRYVAKAVETISEAPVAVVPHVVDQLPARADLSREDWGWPPQAFVFLYVFDVASTIQRKNPVGLLRAFHAAFYDRPDVLLVLKYNHAQRDAAGIAAMERLAAGLPNVRLISDALPLERLCSLYQLCDCYVSPHRSEGFGLTIAAAMYYGKPVIATGFSGNMDFTDASNAFLIDYTLAAVAEDAGEYRKNFVWAAPHTSHLSRLLHEVIEHPEEARTRAARGQETVRRCLSRAAVEAVIRRQLAPFLPADC